jgi:GNAT superfamily N-acetyltransferase
VFEVRQTFEPLHIREISKHLSVNRIEMGSFGSLQVDERFQRRGLGSLIVKVMSKRLAEQNKDITAGIVDDNFKSRQMFQKLGFKHIDDTHWFTISPSIPHFRWVD